MTADINYAAEIKLHIPWKQIIEEVIRASLREEGCPFEAEVSVTITGPEEIRELNRDYRDRDQVTDVLSFPMMEFQTPADFSACDDSAFNPETGELVLGDIVLNAERVISQAEEYGHSRTRELAFLTAHSMLHLMGYDHMEEKEREEMEARQKVILEAAGYPRKG